MRKSLAKRAAELGTDEETLVRALLQLCQKKTVSRGLKPVRTRYGLYHTRNYEPLLQVEQAAKFLNVHAWELKEEIKRRTPKIWTEKMVIDAMFAFHEREGRWPTRNDMKATNDLPSRDRWIDMAWAAQSPNIRVSSRDWWERKIGADKRCTPMMAIGLRNVLARKEAIDRIGFKKFLKQGLATVRSEHAEFGTLYELPGETSREPMVLLKVVNSTPEADGSFADYYLRVPPEMTDVQEAVKWTFNGNDALGSLPYAPLVET